MTEQHHRDPLLDPPRRKKKLSTGLVVGIGISVLVHLIGAWYIYNAKFVLREVSYSDESIEVELIDPIVEPPPPPPPPPPPDQPPPPKLQVREPVSMPDAPPPPVTLPIEATKKEDRVEYTGPPVIVPGPPPPPAPPAPPAPSVITNPDWVRRPSGADLARFYPSRAASDGTEGSSTIECTVQANGRLTDCSVVSESPAGAGFGRAHVQLASRFQMRPQTRDGAPVGGARVRIPIAWRLG